MKLIIFGLLSIIPGLAYSQTNLTIRASAPLFADGTKVLIQHVQPRRFEDNAKRQADSTVVKDHKFEFKFKNNKGEFYFLTINKHNTRLFLQPGAANIVFADSVLNNVSISGNLMADEYKQFVDNFLGSDIHQKAITVNRDYRNYIKNKNRNEYTVKAKREKLDEVLELDNKENAVLSLKWIKDRPDSYLNSYLLYTAYNQLTQGVAETEVKRVFAAMHADVRDNVWGRELKYRMDSLFVGAKAPDFAQADTNGKVVRLSDFKGRYVLVDFWASWCVPCRAENPNVVRAMQQYANRNFTVLGISLDQKKESWEQAIKHDGLNWTQLSDLRYWRNAVSVKYYVYSIPGNYLIGPDGTIIAKNLQGADLLAALERLIR